MNYVIKDSAEWLNNLQGSMWNTGMMGDRAQDSKSLFDQLPLSHYKANIS